MNSEEPKEISNEITKHIAERQFKEVIKFKPLEFKAELKVDHKKCTGIKWRFEDFLMGNIDFNRIIEYVQM